MGSNSDTIFADETEPNFHPEWLLYGIGSQRILAEVRSLSCTSHLLVRGGATCRETRGDRRWKAGNCHVFPSNGPCMSGDPPFIPPSATQSVWREGGGEGEDGVWPGERMTTVEAPLRQTLFRRHTKSSPRTRISTEQPPSNCP